MMSGNEIVSFSSNNSARLKYLEEPYFSTSCLLSSRMDFVVIYALSTRILISSSIIYPVSSEYDF